MIPISSKIASFLRKQKIAVISTFNGEGKIHCSVKGILGVDEKGKMCLIDLYYNKTYENLKKNPKSSITVVDEEKFIGYTLQGQAHIVPKDSIEPRLLDHWEERMLERISKRVIDGVQSGKKTSSHHEARLPRKPKYLIELQVENIIDLSPSV